MTLDQFENRMDQLGQELLNLTPILTEIGNEMTAQLKSAAPRGKTGGLKSSIRVTVQPDSFSVSMRDYGAYQNYGVRGVKNATFQSSVEDGISAQPRTGNEYSFRYGVISRDSGLPFAVRKSIAERGLNAKKWFSVAGLEQEVVDRLQERINQAF